MSTPARVPRAGARPYDKDNSWKDRLNAADHF